AFFASPRSAFVGGPQSRAESWRSFAAYAGHWSLRGYGPFAVEEKATGIYCGRTGPYFPEGWPEPELAWTLMDHAEGRGIAAEAARAARLWAYRSLGWTTAVSVIARGNVRSAALAERLGARREADFPHPDLGPM